MTREMARRGAVQCRALTRQIFCVMTDVCGLRPQPPPWLLAIFCYSVSRVGRSTEKYTQCLFFISTWHFMIPFWVRFLRTRDSTHVLVLAFDWFNNSFRFNPQKPPLPRPCLTCSYFLCFSCNGFLPGTPTGPA